MARCPSCSGTSFEVENAGAESLLACAGCGLALGSATGVRLAELQQELQRVREELNRLRQAVNFLNQRVR